MKLLVVEDDLTIAEPLLDGLRHHGFDVFHAVRGAQALDALGTDAFDVILLDLGLPDLDGLDVCRKIRSISTTPVIMLTARSEEVDRVVGLELGADDYVVTVRASRTCCSLSRRAPSLRYNDSEQAQQRRSGQLTAERGRECSGDPPRNSNRRQLNSLWRARDQSTNTSCLRSQNRARAHAKRVRRP